MLSQLRAAEPWVRGGELAAPCVLGWEESSRCMA